MAPLDITGRWQACEDRAYVVTLGYTIANDAMLAYNGLLVCRLLDFKMLAIHVQLLNLEGVEVNDCARRSVGWERIARTPDDWRDVHT